MILKISSLFCISASLRHIGFVCLFIHQVGFFVFVASNNFQCLETPISLFVNGIVLLYRVFNLISIWFAWLSLIVVWEVVQQMIVAMSHACTRNVHESLGDSLL